MATALKVGDQAPDFDLTSTEGVVLMLQDEVPRTQVLLYVFSEATAATASLETLARRGAELAGKGIKVLALCEAPLDELTALQQQHALPFPLLHDDRGFSKIYGGDSGAPVLVLVDRDQRVASIELDRPDLEGLLTALLEARRGLRDSTANYPRSVINRLVDRWVN